MPEQKQECHTDKAPATDTDYYIRYLEKELAQARKVEETGIIAGVVAHDLNNILTPIFGYATILKRDLEKDHPLSSAVGVIEKSAERASALVSKLLGCSREQEPNIIPFDIIGMLEKFLESIAGNAHSIGKSYSEVPAVMGDPHHIAVVIRAIADNAIAAVQQGGTLHFDVANITIDSEFSRHHPPVKTGPHVCITITDTGQGMPAEVLAKSFEPFYTTKLSEFGAGIGLTIAQSLLRRNFGCITLESVEGKGTTVKIFLPAAQP